MNWTVKYSASFKKQAKRLPRAVVDRIDRKLCNVLAKTQNPQSRVKGVEGFAGLWSYRVGDYRVLCRIYDEEMVIIPIAVAHRSTVYQKIPAERAPPAIGKIEDGDLQDNWCLA